MSAASRAAGLLTQYNRTSNTMRPSRTWALYLALAEVAVLEQPLPLADQLPLVLPRLPPELQVKMSPRKSRLLLVPPQPPLPLPQLRRLLRRPRRPSSVRRSTRLAPTPTVAF